MIAAELPIRRDVVSILDLETTGLSAANGERIVEISIVRVPPDGPPEVVFDTLVHPGGPVRGTSIHGITDDDVEGAPHFWEIAPEVIAHLDGTIVGTYNAAFDLAFLASEFSIAYRGAPRLQLPYLCLMWMHPQLGLGSRCSLHAACGLHGITPGDHSARADAIAAAHLWSTYAHAAVSAGVPTFDAWRRGKRGKFWDSLDLPVAGQGGLSGVIRPLSHPALKPRSVAADAAAPVQQLPPDRGALRRAYWHALLDVFEDERVTPEEVRLMHEERRRLGLTMADVRAVHAKFFGNRLEALSADQQVSDEEDEQLRALQHALLALGWAPGK